MSLFDWLLIAHLIGDWLFQTEYEVLNKAKGRFFNQALWAHVIKYTACFVPVVYLFHLGWWPLVPIFASHLWLDRRTPIIWWQKNIKRANDSWPNLVVDQIFHLLVIVVIAVSY